MMPRPPPSARQGEGFGLDAQEQPPDRAHGPVQKGMFRTLQIGEKPAGPGRQMPVEEALLRGRICRFTEPA
jgi:hypothetical protein